MNKKQMILIVGALFLGLISPNMLVGVDFLCVAVGAYLSIILQ